jgi:nitrate/TMAO reductase-like tetraheme cytochrome c subunit
MVYFRFSWRSLWLSCGVMIAVSLCPSWSWSQAAKTPAKSGLLDDDEEDAGEAKGGLLDKPAKTPDKAPPKAAAKGGLLDDDEEDAGDAKGGLLDKPAPPPTKTPAKGGLLDDDEEEGGEGGLLTKPATPATVAAKPAESEPDPHAAILKNKLYPTAAECGQCHVQQYEEWRGSAHAYASISPMFHKFEQKINDLSSGTIGTFCVRCHSTVGTQLGEPRELPLWDRAEISREGITCITCHRVNEQFGKVNGERRIVAGELSQPVYGNLGGDGVAEVIARKAEFKVATEPGETGARIHQQAFLNPQLAKSEFCLSCHQVAVHPGIKLEIVWEQFRASPAHAEGTRCQDCHMSTRPGQPSGFATGPLATINGKTVRGDRTLHNHAFVGPGYPVAHPGIFPQNPKGNTFTIQQWLTFDYRAGWGTDAFEASLEKGQIKVTFPAEWTNVDDRYEARTIIASNLKKLDEKKDQRKALMEAGSQLDGPFFKSPQVAGKDLNFRYRLTNRNRGHNLPSGSLGAQPEIWLNVALIDPTGKRVWESGYVDKYGDFADLHSHEVRAGTLPHDGQLFNLQSKFLTTNVKGTDREMYLPVNFDIDQIPFIRPANVPTTVLNHPPFIRMENRSLPPLASRDASYTVPGKLLTQPGTYRLAVRLRSRAEPIYFMRFCDATEDMQRAMNEWMLDMHPYTVAFEVKAP